LPSPVVLDPFLGESGYCITSVACKAAHFRPDAGVEIESDAHLLAIDTKMAFTVASLLLGIGQGHRSGGADMVIPYRSIDPKLSLEWLAAGVRAAARQIRGKFFRWPERAMDCNVACSLIGAPSCSGYT
jgi:hypothetical protein